MLTKYDVQMEWEKRRQTLFHLKKGVCSALLDGKILQDKCDIHCSLQARQPLPDTVPHALSEGQEVIDVSHR